MSYMNKPSDLDSGIMTEPREAQELESELPKRPEPWENEVKANVLTPLFEIVSHIAMETDIPLHFEVDTGIDDAGNRISYITWWVGGGTKTASTKYNFDVHQLRSAGDMFDYLYTDNIDEDKLNRWVAELEALAFEPETPDQDSESREDFERVENAAFDKGNRE